MLSDLKYNQGHYVIGYEDFIWTSTDFQNISHDHVSFKDIYTSYRSVLSRYREVTIERMDSATLY